MLIHTFYSFFSNVRQSIEKHKLGENKKVCKKSSDISSFYNTTLLNGFSVQPIFDYLFLYSEALISGTSAYPVPWICWNISNFLCILTSDSIFWIYECFEVSSLFHRVWDNMIYTILSLYYTCLKKVFVMFDILKYCYFRSLAVYRWSGWPVLPVGPPVSKTSSFLWV